MNSALLSVGVAIVLALFTALIAPFFIDWNAYKHVLEARLSEAVGQKVTIGEVVELRLLPTPVVKAADLSIDAPGKKGDVPVIAAPRVAARIALTPILRGEIEIDDIVIEHPEVQVQWRRDGEIVLPGFAGAGSPVDPQRVSLRAIQISEGSITIRDDEMREVRTLTGVNLTGEAGSLEGPFKAEGGAVANGVLYTFRLATGRVQPDGAMRAKLALQPASGEFELALDGLLSKSEGVPAYSGTARLQKVTAAVAEDLPPEFRAQQGGMPWRVAMDFDATPLKVKVSRLALAIGPGERAVQLAGSGAIELYPALRISADLQTRQIDLDRALGHGPGGRAEVAELGTVAAGLRTWIKAVDAPLSLRLRADAALINGGLAEDLDVAADVAGGRVAVKTMRMRLPGKSVMTGEGSIALGEGPPSLEATTQLETRQAGVLLQWLGTGDFRIGALKVRPGAAALVVKTNLHLGEDALRLDDIEAQIDDSAIVGQVVYQGGERRKLDLALGVDSIDLGRYFDIVPQAAPGEGAAEAAERKRPPADIALRLDADMLSLGDVSARELVTDLVYSDGSLTVKSLSVGDLDGTSLAASGRIDDVFGRAEGELTAAVTSDDLTGVAKLAADFGITGRDGEDLVAQAAAMSPAAIEATLKAARSDSGTEAKAIFSAALGGTITRVEASFRGRLADVRAGTLDLSAEANSPDGERLLVQLGLPAGSKGGGKKQPGRARLTVSGPLAGGAKLSTEADLLGVSGRVDGTLTLAAEPAFSGKLELTTPDARALLRRLDVPGKDGLAPLPAALSGNVGRKGAHWKFDKIDGRTGSQTFNGDIALDLPDKGPRRLDGKLDFDSLSASWVLAAVLGDQDGATAPGAWPEQPFDLSAMRLFQGKIGVSADRLELPGGASAGGARFDLVLGPGSIGFDNLKARLYGGAATGNLRLAASTLDSGASLSGDILLKNAVIGELAWAPSGTPVATGTFDLAAHVAGSGRSWLGLVSSLSGDGTFSARNGVLRGLDPQAFIQVIRASDAGLELKQDGVEKAFRAYLSAGALPYDRFEGAFEVSDGVMSAKNVALETAEAGVRVSTLIDLHALSIDSEWTLTPNPAIDMVGAPPVTLVFAGPLSAPQRQLDVSALTGYLTVRRIEEDVRSLETAQQDALERERLDRLLVRRTQEHMRRVREERERARIEAQRLEAEQLAREREAAAREEAARQEAARQEAARQEAARQEAARQEAARQEAARQEAARQEAARQEAARQEAARQEAARQEALQQETLPQEALPQEALPQDALPQDAQTGATATTGSTSQFAPEAQQPSPKSLEQLVEEALRKSAPAETLSPTEPVTLTAPVLPPQAQQDPAVQQSRRARRPVAPIWSSEPQSGSIELQYDPLRPGG